MPWQPGQVCLPTDIKGYQTAGSSTFNEICFFYKCMCVTCKPWVVLAECKLHVTKIKSYLSISIIISIDTVLESVNIILWAEEYLVSQATPLPHRSGVAWYQD